MFLKRERLSYGTKYTISYLNERSEIWCIGDIFEKIPYILENDNVSFNKDSMKIRMKIK